MSGGFGEDELGDSFGTAPFYRSSGIIDSVLTATGHGTPASELKKRLAVLGFLNARYQEIFIGQHWNWMQESIEWRLQAPYTDGTASATYNSQTVSGLDTAWNATLHPYNLFFFNSSHVVYFTSTVESNISLTLSTKFSEDDISDAAYTLAKSRYRLPVETDQVKSIVVDSYQPIQLVGVQDFRAIAARDPARTGTPKMATVVKRNRDDDMVYIEFWPAPDKAYQVKLDITLRAVKLYDATTSIPLVPDRYRSVLFYGALADFQRNIMNQGDKADRNEGKYNSLLVQMRNDKQLTEQRMQMRAYTPAPFLRRHLRVSMTAEDFGKID